MRQLRLLALLAPAVLLVPIVACEDSSSSTPTPFTFEAGPGFEAGPPAEAGPLPDAGDVDAADVFVPPAPKGVTVTVIDNSLPKADVRVISQDATGAVIADAKTDAAGKLTIATAPATVTVLAASNTAPTPVTFFAVEDGDTLVVRIPPAVLVEQAPVGHYSVTFTPGGVVATPHANVTVGGGCSNSTLDTTVPLVVDLFPSCVSATNVIFGDGSAVDGTRNGFAFKKGVAPPAANASADVTLPAWDPPGATTLTASHLPSGYLSVDASLYMIANGASFGTDVAPGSDQINSVAGRTFQTATGFADAYQSFVHTVDDTGGLVESSILRRETAPATTTLPDFDFTNALPYITATALDSTTVSRPIVTLTSDKPLTAVDGGIVVLSWTSSSDAAAAWTFVVPASAAATFKAPALPTDVDAQRFTPIGPTIVDSATFFEATQLPGYKETKLIPIVPRASLDLLDASVPLPINGTVRITSWSPQPQPLP